MPVLDYSTGSISGDFSFTLEEWAKLQKCAGLTFNYQHRAEIDDSNRCLLLGASAELNRPKSEDLSSFIENLRDNCRSVHRLLADPPEYGTIAQTAMLQVLRHIPSEARISLIHPLGEMIEATNSAIAEVKAHSIRGTRGPQLTRCFESYVDTMGRVFRAAGGKTTFGTRRSDRARHESKFTDFLALAYGVLLKKVDQRRRAGQHSLPKMVKTKSSEAWAAVIKRMNKKANGKQPVVGGRIKT